MSRLPKYTILLALAAAIGLFFVFRPPGLENIASVLLEGGSTASPLPPESAPVEPTAKASIDEELDYMAARRLASLEGWRGFLAAHSNGVYAQSAQAEVRARLGANGASTEAPVAEAAYSDDEDRGAARRLGAARAEVEQPPPVEKASAAAGEVSNGAPPPPTGAASDALDGREAKTASGQAPPAPPSSKTAIAVPETTATAGTGPGPDQVSAASDSSRSVQEAQTRAPPAAGPSMDAPPSGRSAVLSAGSIDSAPAASANPGASVAIGEVSSRETGRTESIVQGVTDKEILFGMAAPFSGASRELGRQMKIGVETAFNQVNSTGGVNGRQLRLVSADDGYEPEKTADAMRLLYDKEKVFGFIGNVGTPTAAVALPFALDHRALFFGAFTGASLLRRDPPDRYVFNYRASYAEETRAVVQYLVKVKRIQPRELVVFAQQDSYGDSGYAGVQKAVRSLPGNNPDIVRLGYKRNTVDVQGAVDGLRAYRGQIKAVVMIASYRAAAKFIEKTRDLYPSMIYTNVSFVGSTALADELMLLGPRYAAGVIVTQVVPAVNSHATLVLDYKEALARYFPGETPDYVSFEGYIDASVLAEAAKRSGRDIDAEKLVGEIERMHDFELGLGAPITFNPNDHQGSHKVWGSQLDEAGHYQPIDLE